MAVDIGTLRGLLILDDQLSAQLDVAAKKITSAGKTFTQVGQQLTGVGTALTKTVSLPLLLLGGAAVKAASDFESSFAGVRKTVTATEPEFAKLSQGFRNLAKEIPISVNELNKIGEAAGQLGIETDNILSFTRVMADLGVTTNLSADQAATSLARLANITRLPQTEFDRLGATIVELGNTFETTEAEIVTFGLRIAGAGKLAGLTEADILGIGAALSSVGIQAEAGGTAVQKVLIAITQAVAEGNEDLAIFADTAGLSAQQFATAFRDDAGEAFTLFVEGLGRQGDKAFKTLEDLNLQDQRLIRSFLSLAGAGDKLRDAISTGNRAFEENTALTKEASERYKTFASRMTVLKNQLVDVFITLGQSLIPVLKDLIVFVKPIVALLSKAADLFAALPKPVRAGALALLAVVAAIGPLLFVMGQLIFATGQVLTLFGGGLGGVVLFGTALKGITAAAGGSIVPLGALASRILPNFLQKTVQGRDAMGRFTTSFRVFNKAIFTTPLTLTNIKAGFSTLAVSLKGAVLTGLTAVKSAVISLTSAFTSLSIGILGPVAIVAALALFSVKIAKATADAEEAALVLANLNGEMVNGALAVNDVRVAWQEAGEEGLQKLLDTMDPAIIKSQEFSKQLGDLLSSGRVTKEEFQGISATVLEYRQQMEMAVEPTNDVGDALGDTATKAKDLETILKELGITTRVEAAGSIKELTVALESGQVPVKQAAKLIDDLFAEMKDLGLLTPEVEDAILALARAHDTLGIGTTSAIAGMSALGRAVAAQNIPWDDAVAVTTEFAVGLPNMVPPLDRAALGLKKFGIVIPDINRDMANLTALVRDQEAPIRQLVLAIRSQRDEFEKLGVLTPDLAKQLNLLEAETLKNATAADKAALGFQGLFDGFRTGIPEVDRLLGKFSSFLGIFKSLGSALGGLGSKVGSFFSKIGGLFGLGGGGGGLGGGGGGARPFSGLFSSIKNMFVGGEGEQVINIAAKDFGKTLAGGISGEVQQSGFFSKITGFMQGKGGQAAGAFFGQFASALASGASKLEAGLIGALSAGLNFIPVIGPILAQFAGPLFKGLKAIGKKVFGFFKNIFGGPSGAELGGRKVAAEFSAAMGVLIGETGKAEVAIAVAAGGTVAWAQKVIGLRDIFLALGRTEGEALAVSQALWRAEKKGPEAVQAVIAGIAPSLQKVQDAMAFTGLTLTELRNEAINSSIRLGITVAEAFEAIANGTIDTMKKATDSTIQMNQAVMDSVSTTAAANDAIVQASAISQSEALAIVVKSFGDMGASARRAGITVSGSIKGIFAATIDGMKGMVDTSKIQLGDLEIKVEEVVDAITTTMSAGIRTIEDDLISLSSTGGAAFGSIADAADFAAGEAEDRFAAMRQRLTGASIILQMVDEASASIMTIGDAAEQAARQAEAAFNTTNLSTGFAGNALLGPDAGRRQLFPGGTGEREFQRRSGERVEGMLRRSGVVGSAGGPERIILEVDGQVLAEVVLRHQSRTLANKGLGNS